MLGVYPKPDISYFSVSQASFVVVVVRAVAITEILHYRAIAKPTAGDCKQPALCLRHVIPRHTTSCSVFAKPKVTLPDWEHFGFQPSEKANLDEAVRKTSCS